MLLSRKNSSSINSPTLYIPDRKIKNNTCIYCQRSFHIKDPNRINGQLVPVIRDCGHSMCNDCSNNYVLSPCPRCKDISSSSQNSKVNNPVNFYAIGLLLARNPRSLDKILVDDVDFKFQRSSSGIDCRTNECCIQCKKEEATCRCLECTYPYCNGCFEKYHAFSTNKHHKKVSLQWQINNLPENSNICDIHNYVFKHWCPECNVKCCSDCVIDEHRAHSTIEIQKLNNSQVTEFVEAYENLKNVVGQVYNAKKEVKEALKTLGKIDNSANIELEINQHFLYLHGVLQNLECQMIKSVHAQRNKHVENLNEIQEELESLETQLQNQINLAYSAPINPGSVIYGEITEAMKQLTTAPRYLLKHQLDEIYKESISFHVNSSIIKAINDHCSVNIKQSPRLFSLVATDELPEDYEIATIDQDFPSVPPLLMPSPLDHSLTPLDLVLEDSTVSISSSSQSLTSGGMQLSRNGQEVYVEYITHPYCFYVRDKDTEVMKQLLENELKKYSNMNKMIPEKISEGEVYVVEDTKYKKWFRALVKQPRISDHVRIPNVYQIYAIDHGFHNNNIHKSKFRELLPKFHEFPPLVKKYKLFDIHPIHGKTWTSESVEEMKQIISIAPDKLVTLCEFEHDGHPACDLLIPTALHYDSLSVRDALIFLGHGKFTTTEKLKKTNPSATNAYDQEPLELNKCYEMVGLNIESPQCFYVRKVDYNETYFKNMTDEMTKHYTTSKKLKALIYNPIIGMNCAVQYENEWYRGVIKSIPGARQVEIFFVDLGIQHIMAYDKIRHLSPKFTAAAIRAIKLCLKDVTIPPGGWQPETYYLMSHFMEPTAKIFISSVMDDCYIATVFNHNDVSFHKFLYSEKRINSPIPSQSKNSKRKHRCKNKKKDIKSFEETEEILIEETEDENPYLCCVNVVYVVSPDEIYLATTNCTETYHIISDKMQKFYGKQRSIVSPDMHKGVVCAVFSKANNAYYRAKIVEVNESDIKVFLIDEGKYEIIPKASVQSLADELHDIPAYLFKVRLAGIYPTCSKITWSSMICEKLIEIINANENKRFYIAKVGETVNEAMTVDLYVKQAKIIGACLPTIIELNSVNRMLVDEGLALPIKDYTMKKLKVLAADVKKEMNFYDKNIKNTNNIKDESDEFTMDPPRNMSKHFPKDIPKWPSTKRITKNSFRAHVTYIDWDGIVYLHTIEQMAELEEMKNNIKDHYKPEDFSVGIKWSPGDMCMAKFNDNLWYRGVVHQVIKNKIGIELIDYGNLEWQDPSTIRKELILENVPCMASKCQVYGLTPNTPNGIWDIKEISALHFTIVDKNCDVTILSRKNDYNIIQFRSFDHLDKDLFTYLSEEYQMEICQNNIDFDLRSDTDSDSSEINENGHEKYNSASPDVIIEGTMGDSTDEITDMDDDIDTNGFLKNSIVDSNKNEKILKSFKTVDLSAIDTTETKENSNTSEDDSEYSEISEIDNENLQNPQEIVQAHLSTENNAISKNYQSIDENKYADFTPLDISTFYGALGGIDQTQPNIVWIHPTKTESFSQYNVYNEVYIKIQNEMQSVAAQQPLLDNFQVKTPCCARYHDTWYRCIINSSVMKNGSIEVLYIDWGNTEWVDINKLRTMKKEWLILPALALKCRLWNTRTAKSEAAKNWFKNKHDGLYKIETVEHKMDYYIVKVFEMNNDKVLMYQDLIDQGIFSQNLMDHFLKGLQKQK